MEQSDIAKLMLASRGKLRLYAYSLTSDWEKSEDLLQETFLRVLSNAENFNESGNFFSWARKIMHNAYINIAKREERYQFVEQIDGTAPQAGKEKEELYFDTEVEIEEIHSAIDELPGNAGKVMKLYISGHKYLEISVIMNIPIGTVKTRINVSRAILKRKLKDYLN